MIERLSEERLEKIRQLILNPRPGSKVAAAIELGIDLNLMFEQLKKTPQQRVEDAQNAMRNLEKFQQEAKSR